MLQRVRMCLVGAGRVGKVHAQSLSNHVKDAEVVALVDPDIKALSELAEECSVDGRFESLEQAIAGSSFDAVVITTPTFTHAKLAVQAADSGKHIFLEKPMALNMEECDAILAAVKARGVLLQTGFMRRFDPDFESAAERIRAGEIGQPMLIKSLTHGPGLPPPWATDLKTSNGNLAEVNSHDWDCVRWLMGANPKRVYTEIANFKGEERGIKAEHFYDTAIVTVQFEGGGLGCISGVCPCDYGYDARVEIIGEKGIMQIGELKGQAVAVCVDRDLGLVSPIFRSWPQRFKWAYIREMEHFVESIQKGVQPKVGGEDGRWAVAGVLAGTKSYEEERPVYLTEIMGEGDERP